MIFILNKQINKGISSPLFQALSQKRNIGITSKTSQSELIN